MEHIRLDAGQRRRSARNTNTVLPSVGWWQQLWSSASSYRSLFLRNYEVIRSVCRGFERLGVAVVAIDRQRWNVAGSVCLEARVEGPGVAIVGRHGVADLYLDADKSLSLRHLAVIVHPVTSWDPQRLTLSLLDLRTSQQFTSEYDDTLAGLVAEGPVFVRCGRYAIMCFVTGDASDWPERAEDAWSMIPERHYIDVQTVNTKSQQLQRVAPKPRGSRRNHVSRITLVDGPEMAQALLLSDGEKLAGYLSTESQGRCRTIPVGERSLERGVLVGRNPRCDQFDMLADSRISRVHMMLRRVAGRLYAFDIASTGRTFAQHHGQLLPVRLLPVDGPLDLHLAGQRATIRWRPV